MAQSANIQIADFLKASKQGVFKHISPQDVIGGLQVRLSSPTAINQGYASLCGPATFMVNVASDKRDEYVEYVLDLYRTGSGRIGSLKVKPSDDCKNYKPPANKIAPVDWIALASLRDSDNTVFDYDSANDQVSGITMPHSMAKWFRESGYGSVENKTNVYFNKDGGDLKDVGRKQLAGYRVCLFIHAQMLSSRTARESSWFPNHWIGLMSPVSITANDNVNMDVYTWGTKRRLPAKGYIALSDFVDNFYGYVAAK